MQLASPNHRAGQHHDRFVRNRQAENAEHLQPEQSERTESQQPLSDEMFHDGALPPSYGFAGNHHQGRRR
jgi:hypothetical protein